MLEKEERDAEKETHNFCTLSPSRKVKKKERDRPTSTAFEVGIYLQV
jgi:hypothetical protein